MVEWSETYTIIEKDIGIEHTTHGTVFKISIISCPVGEICSFKNLTINGVSYGSLHVGDSIVADGVKFYLESMASVGWKPAILIVSGDDATKSTTLWVFVGIAIILLYLYSRR